MIASRVLGCLFAWLPYSEGVLTFKIGIITFTIYTLGVLLLLPFVVIRALFFRKFFNVTGTDIAILLLCLTYLISTIFSTTLIASGYLAFHGIFIPVTSYLLAKSFIDSDQNYHHTFRWMMFGNTLICFFAIADFLNHGLSERVTVFSRDSIAIGTFALVSLAYLVFSGRYKSGVGLFLILGNIGGLAASLSRGYIVLIALTPILYRVVRRGWGLGLLLSFMLTTLAVTVVLTDQPELSKPEGKFSTQFENSLERITNPDYWKMGLYSRLLTFRSSIRNFEENPIFGTGLKTLVGTATTVHNVHLEWLEYGGFIGYGLFFSVFGLHFWSTARFAKADPLVAANLVIVLVILLNGLTNGFMHGVMPYVAFIVMGFNEARARLALSPPVEYAA